MSKSFVKALVAILVLAAGPATMATAADGPRTIIVLDASGSMWGQIDGRPKLEIAREVVGKMVSGLPTSRELGLMAYGHRSKGDCSDIELLVPAGAGTGPAILGAVNSIRFLGKTPLSEATRQAAESLRYTEDAATVILVTDGIETCEADPCALGAELERSGVNFSAHVIGFGLTKEEGAQVACLAETTGGRYIQAGNAADLAEALKATVNEASEAKPAALPEAGLTAPDEAALGTEIQVGWTVSQTDPLDTIVVAAAGQNGNSGYVYVSSGNPVTIQLPGQPGSYELRYVSKDLDIVARRPISVLPAPVALSAPAQALVGQKVPVRWTGPDADYDTVRLRRPGEDGYLAYDYIKDGNNPVTLPMPDEAGRFELVYMLNDSEAIATRPIEVMPAGTAIAPIAATLTAPARIPAGGEVLVRWTGPGARNDTIQLRLPGDGSYVSSAYARERGNQSVVLTAPSEPGSYELVYKLDDDEPLAQLSIAVVADTPENRELLKQLPVTFAVPADFADTPVQWSAVPLPGQDLPPEAWSRNDFVTGPVSADFAPGRYRVRGDAKDVVFSAEIAITADASSDFVIPPDERLAPQREGAAQPEPAATQGKGADTSYSCDGPVACAHADPATGLAFDLPPGWYTDQPFFAETAAGVRADKPTLSFMDGVPHTIVLNPIRWIESNGSCAAVAAGVLCLFEPASESAHNAFGTIAGSLRLQAPND